MSEKRQRFSFAGLNSCQGGRLEGGQAPVALYVSYTEP